MTPSSTSTSVASDAIETHSSSACAPPPAGPTSTTGIPRVGDQPRVGPPWVAATHRGRARRAFDGREHRSGDRRVGVGLHRRPRHQPRRCAPAATARARARVLRPDRVHRAGCVVRRRERIGRRPSRRRCRRRSSTRARFRRRAADVAGVRRSRSRARAAPRARRPPESIASSPSSGCDPCAARPSYSTRYQANPRWASVTPRSVGSSTTAASGRGHGSTDAPASASIAASSSSMPTEPNSSSAANASTRSPARPAGAAAAATIAAASPPAMS